MMNITIDSGQLITIIVAVFGSTGFWQWLMSIFNRDLKKSIDDLQNQLKILKAGEEKREVENARRRILRFNDEILNGLKHSKEYFDDVLHNDITTYEKYCTDHPEFKNSVATMAIENIERVYKNCLEKNSFI